MDYNLWFSRILHFIVLPIVALSFVITSLTNDARIYLGVANIATHYYPFPQSLDLAWEIKPIANRLINYIFYNVASAFVPMDNHFWFGVAVKLMALAIVIAVSWYFSKQVNVPYTFAVTFLALTTTANFFILQAEFWSLIFSILCISLLLTKSPYKMFIAGCLIPVITMFKGISGLMLIIIVSAVFLLEDARITSIWDYVWGNRYFIAGMVTCGALFLLAQLTIWPHMYSDAMMSAYLANAAHPSFIESVLRFSLQLVLLPIYLPILAVGIPFGVFFIHRLKYLNDRFVTLAYILMWCTPILILAPQGEYFMYQYTSFALPAIVTMVLSERCLL